MFTTVVSRNSKRRQVEPAWASPRFNQHCAQAFAGAAGRGRADVPFSRVLADAAPSLPYRRRTGEVKTVIHWGQRKLLLSEIEFLTPYGGRPMSVVYAGAAPGTHVGILAELFPTMHFTLVDPAPFTVKPAERIAIVQECFTDELAARLREEKGADLLFISDIRTADHERHDEAEVERRIKADMESQQRWHMLMAPERSMLKFRLPWDDGSTEYLDGDVMLPVWGPVSTSEARLITRERSLALRTYDNKLYEGQMFRFNVEARPAMYFHDVRGGEGLDHCYDCTAEVHILSRYLEVVCGVAPADVPAEVSLLSRRVSRNVAANRTLRDPNPDPADRRRRIWAKQSVNGLAAYEAGVGGIALEGAAETARGGVDGNVGSAPLQA